MIDNNVALVCAAIANLSPAEGVGVLLWVAASKTAKATNLPTDPGTIEDLAKAASDAFENFSTAKK